MVQHLDSVVVLLSNSLRQAFEHLQEDRDVVALGNAVSIGIHLESPSEA